ncbi:hypothetical protein NDU88_007395 [Pleurodeles waltl]|uniref:Uncharacterized protein n=1 Tax=Pleurodeles waltl TaxID=8319 RepID=A0AAV7LRX5_PLEWA|nr:hypothetical protein NDU88_007395 [Pleurodeles waltl]
MFPHESPMSTTLSMFLEAPEVRHPVTKPQCPIQGEAPVSGSLSMFLEAPAVRHPVTKPHCPIQGEVPVSGSLSMFLEAPAVRHMVAKPHCPIQGEVQCPARCQCSWKPQLSGTWWPNLTAPYRERSSVRLAVNVPGSP